MASSLTVDDGETWLVEPGTTQTYSQIEYMEGQLTVEGTLVLDGSETTAQQPPTGEIDLPMAVEFDDMNMGVAIFLVGIMSVTLSVSYALQNYAAGIMWSLGVIALIVAGLFGMGLEIFWLAMISTIALIIVGMVVRWIQ